MASPDLHRKSKKASQENAGSSKVTVAKQLEPSHGYDEYLILLQQRNKVLDRFKYKDEKQRELERKEQGFCLYLNGANVAGKTRAGKPSPRRPSSRKLESALDAREMESMLSKSRRQGNEPEISNRSRTAPEKNTRKVWAAASMQIKTGSGQKMHVHAPDHVTGHYDDDFDEYVSESFEDGIIKPVHDEFGSDELQNHESSSDHTDADEANEEIIEEHLSDDDFDGRSLKPREAGRADERLTLSIAEVQALRRSLVMNTKIRQNASFDKKSGSSGSEEEIGKDGSVTTRKQALPDPSSKLQQLQPCDIIVLEFAPRKNEAKSLGTPRKANSVGQPAATSLAVTHNSSTLSKASATPSSHASSSQPSATRSKLPSTSSRTTKIGAALPSSRKVSTAEAIESSAERSVIVAALQAENERLLQQQPHYRLSPATATSPTSRGSSSTSLSSPIKELTKQHGRSSSVQATGNDLTPGGSIVVDPECSNTVRLAMERVLQLDPEQQWKLLIGLEHLEQAVASSTDLSEHRKSRGMDAARDGSAVESQPRSQPTSNLVTMEWLSNWGHGSRIGMTEVQLFDSCNKQVTICLTESEDAPQAINMHSPVGKVEYLFNQKFKTVKEKNMFSCAFTKEVPNVITFVAYASAPLSYFKLWNYNRSMDDLSIGVRRIRLSIENKLVFDGQLEKGCGNQVFDYSTVINISSAKLHASSAAPYGSTNLVTSEATLEPPFSSKPPLPVGTARLPSSDLQSALKTSHPQAILKESGESNLIGEPSKLKLKNPHKAQMPMVSKRMTAHLAHIAGASEQDSQRQKGSTATNQGSRADKPFWLPQRTNAKAPSASSATDPACASSEKPAWLKRDSSSKAGAPDDSGSARDDTGNHLKSDELATLPSWPNKGIPHLHTVLDEPTPTAHRKASPNHQALAVADEHEEAKWRKAASAKLATVGGRARDGSSSTAVGGTASDITKLLDDEEEDGGSLANEEDVTPLKRIERLRARWRNNRDLEKSWSSLSAFNHNQRGRISMDLEGDVLDEYVRSMRSCASSSDKGGIDSNKTGDVPTCNPDAPGEQPVAHKSQLPTTSESNEHPVVQTSLMPTGDALMSVKNDTAPDDEDDFMIPELPFGKELTVNIKTTWGDRYYVGLNGIEIFTSTGEPAAISKISADPADVNVLPGYGSDPRVVQNLIDGVNRTRDDIHMWLAPFTPGANHCIYITFDKPCNIALMRLWNYNKSRIHSYRGAKDVEISLDGKFIFKGELARACGSTQGDTEAFGDTILFTTSEDILEAISRYDEYYEGAEQDDSDDDENKDERPTTADNDMEERPFTSVDVRKCAAAVSDDEIDHVSKNISFSAGDAAVQAVVTDESRQMRLSLASNVQSSPGVPHVVSSDGDILVYKGKKLVLNFVETWGDQFYLGLTGLELISPDGSALPVEIDAMEASPRDLHVMPGYEDDSRTLDKLIDGVNITTSDEHMWLIPFASGQSHRLTFSFEEPISIVGLRFWNYNKSPEDTYRGAKVVHVELDGAALSPPCGLLIRKAPGNCYFDFAQELMFFEVLERCAYAPAALSLLTEELKKPDSDTNESYLSPVMPTGFIYQFHLLSTWGDHYYVGLNGLEFYDENGMKIKLDDNNIAAYPQSVNVLDNVSGDVRTPDKLIDGVNDSKDAHHMWLAPILPSLTNRVFVIFDQPQTISMIKIWNYSKTSQRGVKEFALLVDDLLVWNGQLKPVSQAARGIVPTVDAPQSYHTILFTTDASIIARERHTIISNLHEEQDIRMTNDSKVITASGKQKSFAQKVVADQALRPKTSVTNNKKSHMRK